MPEERPEPEDAAWLLQPPSQGNMHERIAVGSEVELSADARAALEDLMIQLQDDEVMGFLPPCGGLDACTAYKGSLGKCTLISSPCFADVQCIIASSRYWQRPASRICGTEAGDEGVPVQRLGRSQRVQLRLQRDDGLAPSRLHR